jgi:hypothetical protein
MGALRGFDQLRSIPGWCCGTAAEVGPRAGGLADSGVRPRPCLALPTCNSSAIVRNIPYAARLDRFHLCDPIDERSDLDSCWPFVDRSMRHGRLATYQIGTARVGSPARPGREDELVIERGIATQLSSNPGACRSRARRKSRCRLSATPVRLRSRSM